MTELDLALDVIPQTLFMFPLGGYSWRQKHPEKMHISCMKQLNIEKNFHFSQFRGVDAG